MAFRVSASITPRALLVAPLVALACSTPTEGTDSESAGSTQGSSGSESGATTSASTSAGTTTMGGSGSGEVTSGTGSTTASGETDATSAGTAGTSGTSGTSGSTGSTGSTGGDTTTTGGVDTTGVDTSTGGTTGLDTTTGVIEPNPLWDEPNLWYSVDKSIMYIQLNPADGTVVKLVHNQLVPDVATWHGQDGITMLEGGSLLLSRESAQGTQIYYVADPPITDNTPAMAKFLGNIKADMGQASPRIEALYTDCDNRVYLMDTGKDVSSAEGNRLLRFTGDYLNGDLNYEVITDLQKASVADIDDMSPGVVNGEINDKLGFAIDSTQLWQIDYTTGTGTNLAKTSGTWGVHALGAPLFDDAKPRLYVLSQTAQLFEVSLVDYKSSGVLVTGPDLKLNTGYNGWSGLAGPLTECVSKIPQ